MFEKLSSLEDGDRLMGGEGAEITCAPCVLSTRPHLPPAECTPTNTPCAHRCLRPSVCQSSTVLLRF